MGRIELTEGIHLSVIPTTQFKTTRIAVHFMAPADAATYSARTLLTSVLETSSTQYSTQTAVAAELERLYGANFGIGVARDGGTHRVTATLQLVADDLAQAPLLEAGFAFLTSMLNEPLMPGGQFDPATVMREQANLAQYLASLDEDRQMQANLATQALYFTAPAQQVPSFGTLAGLEAVDNAALVAAYREMMTRDAIEIVVLGAVDPDSVARLAQGFDWSARPAQALALSVDQPLAATVRLADRPLPVNQAKLNLAYHVDTDLYGDDYFATLVAEELFGGSPLSLLFTNVREKASLAYSASTVLDPFRRYMVVQTGIDTAAHDAAKSLIDAQLKTIQTGDFAPAFLQTIKDGLLNSRLTAYDSPRFLARQGLLSALIPTHIAAFADYAARVQAVTTEQVAIAAQHMVLQAEYFGHEQEGVS